ncbi:hypothetical protein ACFFJX_26655 [Pseudarcicella hirudinis]|uniref:hypothetical protein n=1 Tax=Pseudarcicella hirudinis TaxID=1079859 RepID=UPI0035F010F8
MEIGQLIIVLIALVLSFIMTEIFSVKKHDWNLILSGMVAGIAITLITGAAYFAELFPGKIRLNNP